MGSKFQNQGIKTVDWPDKQASEPVEGGSL